MLYLYPTTIGDDVLDAMAEHDKVCGYVDLPLQHASDAVLKRMKRPGTRASYERLLDRIRTRVPDVTLRTTFIVGYPGETADDFEELHGLRRRGRSSTTSACSPTRTRRARAPTQLADDVPAAVKDRRRASLMAPAATNRRTRAPARASATASGCWWTARRASTTWCCGPGSAGQAPDIDPVVYLTDCDPSDVHAGRSSSTPRSSSSRDYDLVARPCSLGPGLLDRRGLDQPGVWSPEPGASA